MAHSNKRFITCLVTTACNLRCKYCITSSMDRRDQNLDLDFARAAIREYFERTRDFKVRFYSVGEPTQNLAGIKEIWRFAQELSGGGTYFELLTNGYFGKDTLEWVGDHINRVWVSYDGPPDVNDGIRVTPSDEPSTAIVLENIARLTEMTSVGIGHTVSRPNLHRQVETIEWAARAGVSCIISKAVLTPVGSTLDDVWSIDIMDYAREFLKAWRRGREIGVHYTNDLVFNFDGHCGYYCRACDPCPHLTVDGYVSACDRAFSGDTPLQDLIYGRWNAEEKRIEYFPDRIRKLHNRRVDEMEECRDCEIRYKCGGHCLGTVYQHNDDFMQPLRSYCPAIKFLWNEMSKDMRPGEYWPVEYTN